MTLKMTISIKRLLPAGKISCINVEKTLIPDVILRFYLVELQIVFTSFSDFLTSYSICLFNIFIPESYWASHSLCLFNILWMISFRLLFIKSEWHLFFILLINLISKDDKFNNIMLLDPFKLINWIIHEDFIANVSIVFTFNNTFLFCS